jgi:hypothetical protein
LFQWGIVTLDGFGYFYANHFFGASVGKFTTKLMNNDLIAELHAVTKS